MKTSTLRGREAVTIQSLRPQVWEYAMELAKIAEYNPRLARVEPGSGAGRRASGESLSIRRQSTQARILTFKKKRGSR